ncbi:MAG: hypothetical protein HQL30_03225 [Candidatus Omnitrophica bacterium]|nr:hypothetical protein [Candidatus Omnitrophota bacterium]
MKKSKMLIAIAALHYLIGLFALLAGFTYSMSKSVHPIFVFVFTAAGMLYLVIGTGLFKLKNWARILSVIIFSLAIAENLFSQIFVARGQFNSIELSGAIFRLAVSAFIIFYLARNQTKVMFTDKTEQKR